MLPFFLNCATHAPMSEMVMFSPKKVKPDNSVSGDTLFYSRLSFALGYELRSLDEERVEIYADEKFPKYEDGGEASYTSAIAFSLHAILMSRDQSGFALNISMIPTAGIDATFKIIDKQYLTLGYTVYGGEQVIFQRRLVYNNDAGLAAGFFYEHTWQGYDDESIDYPLCEIGPEEVFYLKTVGARVSGFFHDGSKNRTFVKGNLKIGYVLELEEPYVGIGCSVGVF